MSDDSGEIVKEAAESVAFENVKVGGGAPAFYQALAMGNAVANQQMGNAVGWSLIGKIGESIVSSQPSEMGGEVTALGQLAKALAITPPPTGGGQ